MSTQQVGEKATLTMLGDRQFRVERAFPAPPERVFAAYVDPELIPHYWGPRGTTTRVDELDARPGGRWRFVGVSADGSEAAFCGVYREVTPSERIVQTFEYEGWPGYVSVDSAEFQDRGDGTTLVVSTTTFHTPEEREGMIESGMESGMNDLFDRLEELLTA
jgi:uncharacterized protein YndB with AHSA1/START domain